VTAPNCRQRALRAAGLALPESKKLTLYRTLCDFACKLGRVWSKVTATWILLGLSAICLTLFAYPYLLYPRILRLLGEVPLRRGLADHKVSILFCAHNEKASLPAKMESLRVLKERRPDVEILVYDDFSSDGSSEILSGAADLLTAIRGEGRTGKAAGMKQLARLAKGEILLFTDANILLAADAIDRLLPYYSDEEVGGVACTIRSLNEEESVTSEIGSAYLLVDDRLQELESRTGNVMGAHGGLFSVRRGLYPDFPDTVQDDFTVSMSVIFQGKRLVKALDVIGFENKVTLRSDEVRRKMRIGARAYHTHACMRASLRRMSARDRMKYISRKMLRWFGGIFLALGMLFGLAAVVTLSKPVGLVLVLAALVGSAVALRSTRGLLGKAGELSVAVFATLAGVLQGMSGRTVATWTPAKSR
jgi:glycosyltransferase involved in cell wall biosynthesis